MRKISDEKKRFIGLAAKKFGAGATVTRQDVVSLVESNKLKWPSWLVNDKQYRVARGSYRLPTLSESDSKESPAEATA